jgi:hypothetical protein
MIVLDKTSLYCKLALKLFLEISLSGHDVRIMRSQEGHQKPLVNFKFSLIPRRLSDCYNRRQV